MKASGTKQVRQVFSLGDIVLLAALLALGIVFMIMGKSLFGLGIAIVVCWACMIPFWKHGYRIEGRQGMFRLEEIVAPRSCKDAILAYLDGSSDILDCHTRAAGGAIVEIYTDRSGTILARYWEYADDSSGKDYDLHEITPARKTRLEQIEVKDKSRPK